VDDPLIVVRAVQFAATLSLAGAAIFTVFIAQPALRLDAGAELRALVGRRLSLIAWSALALTLFSGAARLGGAIDQRATARGGIGRRWGSTDYSVGDGFRP
jgi:hypothetical protein